MRKDVFDDWYARPGFYALERLCPRCADPLPDRPYQPLEGSINRLQMTCHGCGTRWELRVAGGSDVALSIREITGGPS